MPQAYKGPFRRLVIAFDVGTTFSGISYCILDPGCVPEVRSVTKFPGQENAAGSPKIPTVLCYDDSGRMTCAGAETLLDNNVEMADTEGWDKVQLFKLRMRPNSMPLPMTIESLPPLPANKSVIDVFGDFLKYLMFCAEQFIKSTHALIADAHTGGWDDMRRKVTFIVAHPNGWEGAQQTKYRKAAIKAGLVPDTQEGRSRIIFVTEGEASLHYCVRAGAVDYNSGNGFVIADLGGGTLDFSAYRVTGRNPLMVEEMTASRCVLQGSAFVTRRAVQHLKEKLHDSRYGADEVIEEMGKCFDETTKRLFRNAGDICLIPFGSPIDKDIAHDIRAGKLKLTGDTVAAFFQPALDSSTSAIIAQVDESSSNVYSVYLVGGFSASPYLTDAISTSLRRASISVKTPDGHTVKAVADGSITFYLEHYVTTRVAKNSYYSYAAWAYEANKPDHEIRKHQCFVSANDITYVRGGVLPLLQKGTSVSEEREYRRRYTDTHGVNDDVALLKKEVVILAYSGDEKLPIWEDELKPGLTRTLCTVTADLTAMRYSAPRRINSKGLQFQEFSYEIVLYFGGPEMTAQVVWTENGVVRRGAAEIIYEDAMDIDDNDDDVGYVTRELSRRL